MSKKFLFSIIIPVYNVEKYIKDCLNSVLKAMDEDCEVIIINDGRIVLDDSMTNLKYHYLNKKVIEAKLEKSAELTGLKGVSILKKKGNGLSIEVDTTQTSVPRVIKALKLENIQDINISNTPLETIIKDIYRKEKSS